MTLLEKYLKLKKTIDKNSLPVADISHHKDNKNVCDKPLPAVDISHHKDKKINEDVVNWANKTQPAEHAYDDIKIGSNGLIHRRLAKTIDAHAKLAEEHINNLSGNHHAAVNAYVMGGLSSGDETGSRRVNNHLLRCHKEGTEPKKNFSFKDEDGEETHNLNIDHLDDALKQNKLKKSLTTYSGIGFNPSDVMDKRNKLHIPAYTSSSTNRSVALLYAGDSRDSNGVHHVLQVTHPKGSTGLYMGDNEDLSPFGQKEHISPRNMTLSVNPTPEIHEDSIGRKVHIWSAKRMAEKA